MLFVNREFEASRTVRKKRSDRVRRRKRPRQDADPPERCDSTNEQLSDTVTPWLLHVSDNGSEPPWFEPNPTYICPHPEDTTYFSGERPDRTGWGSCRSMAPVIDYYDDAEAAKAAAAAARRAA